MEVVAACVMCFIELNLEYFVNHNIAPYFDQCYQSGQACAVILHPVPSFIDALPLPFLNLSLFFAPSFLYLLQFFHLFLADHVLVPLHAAAIPILGFLQ